jgi:hypothetical protein
VNLLHKLLKWYEQDSRNVYLYNAKKLTRFDEVLQTGDSESWHCI